MSRLDVVARNADIEDAGRHEARAHELERAVLSAAMRWATGEATDLLARCEALREHEAKRGTP